MVTPERAKSLLVLHGDVRPQPAGDWTGSFPIPEEIKTFYRDVGPADVTIEGYGNPYFLPKLADLWDFQQGYRWDSVRGEQITEWEDDWLVVADEGGDPFILLRSTGAILHAECGQGEWDARETFPSLNAMTACLAQLGVIVVEAGEEFTDHEGYISEKSLAKAKQSLSELLGSALAAERVLNELGWGPI